MKFHVAYRNNLKFRVDLLSELEPLYVSQGDFSQYADEAIMDGIGPASRLKFSFGVFFFDYDLGGRLDLFRADGHVENEIQAVQASQHYRQQPQLFWNCGEDCPATFVSVDHATIGDLARAVVARGTAYGATAKYPVTFEEYDRFAAATGPERPGDQGWGRNEIS